MTLEKATRRRGAELEDAILDAVWDEIAEKGYGGLTYEAVATRARTSRAVLYRRWPSREELVLAAIRRLGERTP
ncbi:helix-turn-helix transcriptional regulator, partial [Schumannella luteola]